MNGFDIQLPAIRGIQGNRRFYSVNMPVRLVGRLLALTEGELPPEERAQRKLDTRRASKIADYLCENPNSYVLPALTLLLKEADIPEQSPSKMFTAAADDGQLANVGVLNIPMDSEILVADGQHRRHALEEAVKREDYFSHHTISVTIYPYEGLQSAQKIFHAINATPKKISGALLDTYNHDDPWALIARKVAELELFRDIIEKEKSGIGKTSDKLFTLTQLKNACKGVFNGTLPTDPETDEPSVVIAFEVLSDLWESAAPNLLLWHADPVEFQSIRETDVIASSVVLEGLSKAISLTMDLDKEKKQIVFSRLKEIDWSRDAWEGICVREGKLVKARKNINRVYAVLSRHLYQGVRRSLPVEVDMELSAINEEMPGFELRRL